MLKSFARLLPLFALATSAAASEPASALRCEFGMKVQDQFVAVGKVEIPLSGAQPTGEGTMQVLNPMASESAAEAPIEMSVKAGTPSEGESHRLSLSEKGETQEAATLVVYASPSPIGEGLSRADMISPSGETYESQGISGGCKSVQ